MNTNTLIDIDDYDDDSKELLQSLINSNSFINLNQPYSKTNYYDVEKKYENTFISPKYLKYGIDDGETTIGKNLLLEGLASKFIYTGKDIDNQDTFAYNVSVEYCENGIEVYEKFKKNNSKENAYQLNVYIEKVDSSNYFNFSGKSILVYIGDAFYQNILKKFPNQSVSLFYANQTKGFSITSLSLIPEYLYNISKHKNIDVTKEQIISAFNTAYYAKSYETSIFNMFSKLQNYVSEGFYFIAKKLKDCRISESFYDPKNKDYKAIDFNVDSIIESVTSILDSAYISLKIIPISPNINFILDKIHNIIIQINIDLKQFTGLLNESLKICRAIFSGFVNGFIDFVAFLFDVVGFILGINVSETYQTYAKSVNFIELLEKVINYIAGNFISLYEGILDLINDLKNAKTDVLKEYFESLNTVFSELKNTPKKVGDKVAGVADKVVSNIKELSIYDIAYFFGNIIFEVVVAILLAVFTGGIGNVAKAASGSEKFVQFLRFIGIEFLSSASFGVTDVLQSIKNLFVAFSKACKRGFQGFIEWIRSLLKSIKEADATKDISKILDEYSVESRKYLGANLTPAQVKLLEELSKTFYKHFKKALLDYKDVIQVTRKWNALKAMKALNKSDLDELLELRKLKKAFYNKNAAILEIDVLIDGKVRTFKYQSIAGDRGNFKDVLVTNIKKDDLKRELKMTEDELLLNYLAENEDGEMIRRFYDTENKMLDAFDNELRELKATGVNVVVKKLRIKSLYEPCNSCKKQILIRKDIYNIPSISVEAVKLKNNVYAKGNEQLTKIGIK